MFRSIKLLIVLAVLASVGLAAQVSYAAFPYDLAANFSTSSQPSGQWTYGWKNSAGTWNPFTTSRAATTGESIGYWYSGSPPGQQVQNWNAVLYKNTSASNIGVQYGAANDFPGGPKTFFEPGMVIAYVSAFGSGRWSGARWTATAGDAGNVLITARFSMQADIVEGWGGGGGPDPSAWKPVGVSIAKNGVTIPSASATIKGFAGNPLSGDGPYGTPVFLWSNTVTVAAGDTLDFGVSSPENLPVGMIVTIDTAASVGTVRGYVKSPASGNPVVAGAHVTVAGRSEDATSGSDGFYSISLPGGTYSLTASKVGFDDVTASGVAVSNGGTTNQDLILGGGIVSGYVKSAASGNPAISGALVQVISGGIGQQTTSAADGSYSLALASGTYTLRASAASYGTLDLSSVVVVNGSPTPNQNFILPLGVTISGTVTATGGGALSGVAVSSATGGYSTSTNGSGFYSLTVSPGVYNIMYRKNGYIGQDISVDASTGNATQNVAMDSGWSLSADFSSNNPSGAWTYGTKPSATGTFAQSSTFALTTSVSGIAYWAADPGNPAQNDRGRLYWNISGGPLDIVAPATPQDLRGWQPYYFETGMVIGCIGEFSPGNPESRSVARWTAASTGNINIVARFSMQGSSGGSSWCGIVQNGSTMLLSTTTLDGFAGRAVNGYADSTGVTPVYLYSAPVHVTAGDTIDFQVGGSSPKPVGMQVTITVAAAAPGTVSGVVTTNRPGNAPVAGALIQVVGGTSQAVSAADGSYSLSLSAGTYQLQVSKLGYDTKTVSGVVVTSGNTTTQNISLNTSFISGQVTMAAVTGTPIAGAQVATADGSYSSVTDSAGNYSLQVTSGSYKLVVTAANYIPQSANVSVGVSSDITQNFALVYGWDFASAYVKSGASNPFGPWTYGYSTGTDFTVYAHRGADWGVQPWEQIWQTTGFTSTNGAFYGNTDPAAHSATPPAMSQSVQYYLEGGKVAAYALGSSSGANITVARFVVPYGGYYNIQAAFSGQSTVGTESVVSLVSDTHGDLVPATSLSGFAGTSANGFTDSAGVAPAISYSGNIEAVDGEVIDARVTGVAVDNVAGWTGVTFKVSAPPDAAYVKGIVTSSLPGNPGLPGATLTFIGTSVYTATTARDGSYLASVKPGTYRVIVERAGYATSDVSGLSFPTGVTTRNVQLTHNGVWDFAVDYTTEGNPNASWSYGRRSITGFPPVAGPFVPYTDVVASGLASDWNKAYCSAWQVGLGAAFDKHQGWLWKYNGDSPTYDPNGGYGVAMDPGMAGMGCGDPLTDIRWVAPIDMLAHMSVSVSSQSQNTGGVGVTMMKNEGNMFNLGVTGYVGSSLNGFTDSVGPSPVGTFDSAFPVKAGDIFDLRMTANHGFPMQYLGVQWQISTFTGGQTVTSLAQIRSLPVGTLVFLTTPKTLTTSTITKGLGDGSFYIEDDDRSSAMKLVGGSGIPDISADPFTTGSTYKVTFTGTVGQDAYGVKYVMVQSFNDLTPATPLKPLGMGSKALTANGRFVRVWGKVVEMAANPGPTPDPANWPWLYWTINDGGQNVRIQMSGQQGWMNSGFIPSVALNDYIAVAGIARYDASGNLVVTPWVEHVFVDYAGR